MAKIGDDVGGVEAGANMQPLIFGLQMSEISTDHVEGVPDSLRCELETKADQSQQHQCKNQNLVVLKSGLGPSTKAVSARSVECGMTDKRRHR